MQRGCAQRVVRNEVSVGDGLEPVSARRAGGDVDERTEMRRLGKRGSCWIVMRKDASTKSGSRL